MDINNMFSDEHYETELIKLIKDHNYYSTIDLIKSGYQLNNDQNCKHSELYYAMKDGNSTIISIMLKHGALVDGKIVGNKKLVLNKSDKVRCHGQG